MSTSNTKNKLVVILGPTASGKTDLAIKLALRLRSGRNNFGIKGAEIISADSRQVYKGMDIGSGKISKKEMAGVPHYLLSVANPKTRFSVSQYQKLAIKAIKNIQKRGKIPFLVGGTGFYIQSIVDGVVVPEVKPDWKLRNKLEKKSNEELYKMLLSKDPERAKTIDKNNPRRLVRALEIVIKTGKPIPQISHKPRKSESNILQIGVAKTPEELKPLIHKRLIKRLKNDAMINEVKKLRKILSWKRLEEFGLEYRAVAQYLQDKISYQEMINQIQKESEQYVKRQITWFKRDKRIVWIKKIGQADKLVTDFLKKLN